MVLLLAAFPPLIGLLVWLIVLLIIAGLVYWVIGQVPLPPPIKTAAIILLVVVVVIALLYLIMGAIGPPRL